jgi:O-antigen/teichoic acid export membrane protein
LTKTTFVKKVVHSLLSQVVIIIISGLTGVVVARVLGPSGKGDFTLLLTFFMLSITLFANGLKSAQIHLTRKFTVEEVSVNILLISVVIGVLLFLVVYLSLPILTNTFLKDIDNSLIILVAIGFSFELLKSGFSRILQSKYLIEQFNYFRIIALFDYLIIISCVFLIFGGEVKYAVYARISTLFINLLLVYFITSRHVKLTLRLVSLAVIWKLLLYAWKTGFGALFGMFQYRIDVFIVGYFLDSEAVGLYAIGMGLGELLWKIPSAITNVLLPRVANATDEEANILTPQVCRITLIIISFFGVILFLFADYAVILLYGKAFSYSGIIVRLILPGVIFTSIWKILTNDFMARGFAIYYSYSALLAAIVIVTLDILVIPKYGLIGAAVASSIAYFISFAFLATIFSKITNNSIFFFIPRKKDFKLLFSKIYSQFDIITR